MDKSEKLSPYMENSLNAYRSAVKSFGRETLILGLLVIVVCTLTIPYLNRTEQKHAKEEEIKSFQKRVDAARNAKLQLEEIQINFPSEIKIIQQIAKDTSANLVNRWQAFLKAIQNDFSIFKEHPDLFEELRSYQPPQITAQVSMGTDNPPAIVSNTSKMQIQRSNENQVGFQDDDTLHLPEKTPKGKQMTFPPYQTLRLPPEDYYINPEYLETYTICKKVYGRSDEEIGILLQPDILSGNTFRDEDAYNIALQVFKNQISWGYGKLNERIHNRYLTISAALDSSVQTLNHSLEVINLKPLPTGNALLTEPNNVEPSDLNSYATVDDKIAIMIRDTKELTDRLDITDSVLNSIGANVRQTEEMLSERNEKMKDEIDDLEKNIVQIQKDIDKLQKQIKNQLKFTSWLPTEVSIGTQTFIRITPLLLGIILLLMGIRFSRLIQVYRRLAAQFRKHHVSEEEISLILTAPDSLLEWFGGFQPGHLLSPRAVLLVIPAGMLIVIYLLVHKIQQNPLIESGGYEFFAVAFVTAGLGAILTYGTVFRPALKKGNVFK